MSDPLPTHPPRLLAAAPDHEREAQTKIDHLLLAGLDRYFAGEYAQAIDVWTRVLFFDRSHARARAYIDRARSALAERQRESDELLHRGVAAFNAGEVGEARHLLTSALDRGGAHEVALALLQRLNHMGDASGRAGQSAPTTAARAPSGVSASAPGQRGRSWRAVAGVAMIVVGLIAAAVYAAVAWDRLASLDVLNLQTRSAPTSAAVPPPEEPVPIPRAAERALTRAQRWMATGRLHDALGVLETIQRTDPQWAEASRLRADIQHVLLAAERSGGHVSAVEPASAGRRPEPRDE